VRRRRLPSWRRCASYRWRASKISRPRMRPVASVVVVPLSPMARSRTVGRQLSGRQMFRGTVGLQYRLNEEVMARLPTELRLPGRVRMRWGLKWTAACVAVAVEVLTVASVACGATDAGAEGVDQQRRASFDCAKASTRVERMICSSGEISDLDGQLARAYLLALSIAESPDGMRFGQHAWLKDQRNKCADVACLREAYKKRLATFAELAKRPQRPAGSPFVPFPPTPPGAPAIRKVRFPGGETTIERTVGIGGEDERITVRDAEGHLSSESTCNPGDFDSFSSLYTRLKEAVVREDRAAVVKLMAYPLRVNDLKSKKPRTFRKEAALLKAYDEVFTPHVLDGIRSLEPADLFCHDGSVTSDGGMLWANYSGGEEAGVAVINR